MTEPVSHIASMAPYALADLEVPAGVRMISMAQNESLRPPSPLALEAAAGVLNESALYPDPDWSELRDALHQVHGIPADSILCGAGSMELIACIAHAFLGPQDEVLTTKYAYAFMRTATQFTGAEFKVAPEAERIVSVDAILERVSAKTKIVFVANPGNPTGTRVSSAELRRLRAALDQDILLIIDEAYGEFCDHCGERFFDLCSQSNTVILRTFSKAYGLAGMRVGWGCFPENIQSQVRKLLNPNNISIASQAAATAAFMDQDYMLETCRLTGELGDHLCSEARALGIQVDNTHTNFVLLRFANGGIARDLGQHLIYKGILMRQMGGYDLANCLRATIVDQPDLEFVIGALKEIRNRGGLDG